MGLIYIIFNYILLYSINFFNFIAGRQAAADAHRGIQGLQAEIQRLRMLREADRQAHQQEVAALRQELDTVRQEMATVRQELATALAQAAVDRARLQDFLNGN